MKTLNKNEWIAVATVLAGTLIFFGIGGSMIRIFSSAFNGAVTRESSGATVVGSEFPELVSGEDGGLVIYDFNTGEGDGVVEPGDTVLVHYIGFFLNGTPFDTSRASDEPYRLTLGQGQVIEGWEQGLLGMRVGGQRRLIVPPDLAYGEEGYGSIPPNSTLVFDIELVGIEKESVPENGAR